MKIIFNTKRITIVLSTLLLLNACGSNMTKNHGYEAENTSSYPSSNSSTNASAKKIGTLKVSSNKRMLQVDEEGFFWMADTAWKLPALLNKSEIISYLDNRAQKGFNIIQISASYGVRPFKDWDYSTPNEALWDRIDFIIDEAKKRGIYIALLPSWNEMLTDENIATKYGKWIANRYKNKENIIWVNGGDSNGATYGYVWNALGNAIKSVDNKHLMTYHPSGGSSSTDWFSQADWIDFHMIQSGHSGTIEQANTKFKNKYNSINNIPIFDGEPRYEGILKDVFGKGADGSLGRYEAKDVREIAYRQLFSGAFGHTYGNHAIWQMFTWDKDPECGSVEKSWQKALNDKGAFEVGYAAKLMRSRPILSRVPDQSLVTEGNAITTKGDGYAFVYLPYGGSVTVDLQNIGETVKAWWYDPRTGEATEIDTYSNSNYETFNTEETKDWVLVLDDTSKGYGIPGK
jgi:hypothetical protein